VAEIGDLVNSGARRLKNQVLGVPSLEYTKWRRSESIGTIHRRGRVSEIRRSHKLESSQVEIPSVGCSKSRCSEVARRLGTVHLRRIGGGDLRISQTRDLAE
jgi:hypothetical protein